MMVGRSNWKWWLALVGAGLACGAGVWAGCALALASGWSVGELGLGLVATGIVLGLEG